MLTRSMTFGALSALLFLMLVGLACSGTTAGSTSSSSSGSSGHTTSTTGVTGSHSTGSSGTSSGNNNSTTNSSGTSTGTTATNSSNGNGNNSSSSNGTTSGTSSGTSGGQVTLFPSDAPWNQDVSGVAKDSQSDTIINDLTSHGWGNGNVFQIDFSIEVMHADSTTPLVNWTPTSDWYSPDCDQEPMPVPAVGSVEGETGYTCTGGGDCHMLVIHDPTQKLYEMWEANLDPTSQTWSGGCQAVWDLTKHYPINLRGDQCTSADAGGFPITALLFNADEVAAGHIDHAIRFILPNDTIRSGSYVHPGTHSTNPCSGGPNAVPYGARLRLRADYPIANLSPGAQVVAKALQKYGMFLADGGNIALTAQNDTYTTAKWSGLLGARDLSAIQTSDFEVVNFSTPIPYTGDCVRNP